MALPILKFKYYELQINNTPTLTEQYSVETKLLDDTKDITDDTTSIVTKKEIYADYEIEAILNKDSNNMYVNSETGEINKKPDDNANSYDYVLLLHKSADINSKKIVYGSVNINGNKVTNEQIYTPQPDFTSGNIIINFL